MLARSLETILNGVFEKVQAEGGELVGAEHLLRALLGDSACRAKLAACGVDVEKLESILDKHIASQVRDAQTRSNDHVRPTFEFQRALQRAAFNVQTSGRREMRAIDVLVSLLCERGSVAAGILAEQGVEPNELLRQLGGAGWKDLPVNVSTDSGGGCSISRGKLAFATPRPDVEKRLDALEAKLDTAISEIRDLSGKLAQLIGKRPQDD